MFRFFRAGLLLVTCALLFGCGKVESTLSQTPYAFFNPLPEPILLPQLETEKLDASLHPEVWESLHQFHWMAIDGISQETFEGKPFLQKNAEGQDGAAGIVDINRDGEMEFLLAVAHVPRSIPSVEVFALRNGEMRSIGGFFESNENPFQLSYFTDTQGRLLLVQKTESSYGGFIRSLIATDAATWHTFPIASWYSNYDQDPRFYYLFAEEEATECTSDLLYTMEYPGKREVTKEEHDQAIENFMEALTWVEDVEFEYCVQYHLNNGNLIVGGLRGKVINHTHGASPKEASAKYQSPEELKKTSDMVADALYEAYMTAIK